MNSFTPLSFLRKIKKLIKSLFTVILKNAYAVSDIIFLGKKIQTNIMTKFVIACFLAVFCLNASAQHYNNFKVSVYCRAYEVMQMSDTTNYLKPKWYEISRQLKVESLS